MDKVEKAKYVLDQMRIVLLNNDYVRCHILSKKLNQKVLEEDEFQEIKVQYFKYLNEYFLHTKSHIDVSKGYLATYRTPCVQNDPAAWKDALMNYVLYLVLSPIDNERKDMLYRVMEFEKKKLSQIPDLYNLVEACLTAAVTPWPSALFEALKDAPPFLESPFPGGEERWQLLRKRVVEHNIQVVSSYYSRVSMTRLREILGLDAAEAEKIVCELVSAKLLFAKIDRPTGVVRFGSKKETSDVLNKWSMGLAKALSMVEESRHLVAKERMIHAGKLV
eukprot:GHVU01084111.1.p1 GENE.GHVU01084111.1~~GHVU01084111.1.p1  ORF type:complete len:277 (-),score=74.52 GHVU01084111.1:112-942(-)